MEKDETTNQQSEEQKMSYSRIAKNSIFLYFRMILTLLIGLYTSRVLLEALGVQDYGIYNVVGGFVALFSVVSGALTGAISRFITFQLGKGDAQELRHTFNNAIVVLIGISIVVLFFGETIGLWLFYNKLVIPPERIDASFWVFQFAIITFIINLLSTPFNACIIAHERMDAFAYISIIEVIAKLLICFAVLHSPIDKLIFFSLLLCLVGVIVFAIYATYCKRHFIECNGKPEFHYTITKKMFSFASWNIIGSAGWILRSQGGTILLNLFGGPIVNAANAIAMSLSSAVSNFSNCFTNAFTPQITKSYASGNFDDLNKLIIYGPKISFFMLYIIALPVILNTGFILHLWLGNVPDHSVSFVRLILLMSLFEIVSVPLHFVKNATGNIRNYQIIVGSIQILAVPLAYLLLKLGFNVEWLYVAYIITSIVCLFARLYLVRRDIPNWSVYKFITKVCLNVGAVAVIAAIIPFLIHMNISDGWIHLLITTATSLLSTALAVYLIGFNKTERAILIGKLKTLIKHK